MGVFNIIDEPWIDVLYLSGDIGTVSLRDVFRQSTQISKLLGDMGAQDFAVLRILQAVVLTTYSRVDLSGQAYDYIYLEEPDDYDLDDYNDELHRTKQGLIDLGSFTGSIDTYLDEWYERFYLLDDKYPFMQIPETVIQVEGVANAKGNLCKANTGRTLNRTLGMTNNKLNFFVIKTEDEGVDTLTYAQAVRWIIQYHGYYSTASKTWFKEVKAESKQFEKDTGNARSMSKGWLYDIGGVYLEGTNLFETLLLNTTFIHPDERFQGAKQTPVWEYEPSDYLQHRNKLGQPDNLSELLTSLGMALVVDTEWTSGEEFKSGSVKIPILGGDTGFLETQTLYYTKYDKVEDVSTVHVKRHKQEVQFWREFGSVIGENTQTPGVLRDMGKYTYTNLSNINIKSVGLISDGNATSWNLIDEYNDEIRMDYSVYTNDVLSKRVFDEVQVINRVIGMYVSNFYKELEETVNNHSYNKEVALAGYYQKIDEPFKVWVHTLTEDGDIVKDIMRWRHMFKKQIMTLVKERLDKATNRDITGVNNGGNTLNIYTLYSRLEYLVNKELLN